MTGHGEFPIPSTYTRIIARMLGLQERQLPRLLEGTDLPTSLMMPGDETFLTGKQQLQILRNGLRLMGAPEFGLALGQQLQPSTHGPLGYLALSSPDVMSSLEALRDYLPIRLPLVALDVELTDEWLICSYRALLDAPADVRCSMAESFAMVLQSQLEAVTGREISEARVEFSHPPPPYADRYGDYLNSPWHFNADRVAYMLPARMARIENTNRDTTAFRHTRDLCSRLLQQQGGPGQTMTNRVRTLLLSQPQGAINEQKVARALYISRRTLARRLESESTGFRQVRDQVLFELARRALLETAQSVESVAASLGYHDSAAFRKAFRRWSGTTPTAFRRRQGRGIS